MILLHAAYKTFHFQRTHLIDEESRMLGLVPVPTIVLVDFCVVNEVTIILCVIFLVSTIALAALQRSTVMMTVLVCMDTQLVFAGGKEF